MALAASAFFAVASSAAVLELEVNNSKFNNTTATAQAIASSDFSATVPATAFNVPGYKHATINGRLGKRLISGVDIYDIDFYSFSVLGGSVYIDVDNKPTNFDSWIGLFDSSGTLLALSDDSAPDPGSVSTFDSFLGVFSLLGPGTYYLGITTLQNLNAISTIANPLTRPDSQNGGLQLLDQAFNTGNVFKTSGNQTPDTTVDQFAYTIHLSVDQPGSPAIPEPSTYMLLASGFAALALHLRKRSSR